MKVQTANISQQGAKRTKSFNNNLRYVQGFRISIPTGTSTTVITLNSSGKFLLGCAIIPATGADITDTQVTLSINNNNILLNTGISNLNPNFVQGIIYLPTPQPLQGNDSVNLSWVKNNAGSVTITLNMFYVPR